MSSVLPPPISSSSTCHIVRSKRGVQPSRASCTSSAGEMISMRKPGFVVDAVDEGLTVLRAPAGFGRHRAVVADAAPSQLACADPERADGPLDRLLREPPRLRHAFAEPHDAGEGIDDTKARAPRPRDEEPAVVRAEVERAE